MTVLQWEERLLGEVITLKRGYDLPVQDRRPGDYPIVSSSGVTGFHVSAKAKGPGVVTGRYGTLGEVFYIPQDFWPLNTSLYVQNFKGNDPRFVAYFLGHLDLGSRNAAGAVPGVNRNHLHAMTVRVPRVPEQRRIAAVLSAYDDLIENNLRRIGILEEMARALYREWFVDFRFPGHDVAAVVAAESGNIPGGWTIQTVRDSFDVRGGGTPSRAKPEYWVDGDICWFAPRDLTAAGSMFMEVSKEKINKTGLARSSATVFPAYSVMLTSRATIGAIAVNTVPAATNQGFITCLPNDRVPLWFLYWWLQENVSTFERMASGATFKEISRGVFKTISFLHPPAELVRRFEALVVPWSDSILHLQRQVRNLRETRDLLGPRLLSGRTRLADVAEAVAARLEAVVDSEASLA